LLFEHFSKKTDKLSLAKGDELSLQLDGQVLDSIQSISRHLAKSFDATLNGQTPNELTEVDSWLDFAQVLASTANADSFTDLATILEANLVSKQYLVANHLTIADFSIYASLKCNCMFF
jgi:hypothetical protein